MRIFIKTDNNYSPYNDSAVEILKLKSEYIKKVVNISDIELNFCINRNEINDITKYTEVGGLNLDVESVEDCIMFNRFDIGEDNEWFIEILKEYNNHVNTFETALEQYNTYEIDEEINSKTIDDVNEIIEKIKAFTCVLDWMDVFEMYTYWDGHNNKEVFLTGDDCSEWLEVTDDEEHIIEKQLDSQEYNTGNYTLIESKSGQKWVIDQTYYNSLTDTWTITECNSIDEYLEQKRNEY
jgi:hypothetical protein